MPTRPSQILVLDVLRELLDLSKVVIAWFFVVSSVNPWAGKCLARSSIHVNRRTMFAYTRRHRCRRTYSYKYPRSLKYNPILCFCCCRTFLYLFVVIILVFAFMYVRLCTHKKHLLFARLSPDLGHSGNKINAIGKSMVEQMCWLLCLLLSQLWQILGMMYVYLFI